MVVSEYQFSLLVDRINADLQTSYDNILVPEEFQIFWANVAKHFVDNDYVIFDTSKCPAP